MSKNDLAIQALANQCETLADALVKGLETLQVRQSKPRGWKVFGSPRGLSGDVAIS